MKKSLNLLMLFASLLLSPWVAADDAMPKLQQLLSAFTSYSANFQQQTYDEKGFALQQLQGRLTLEKPARFYWQSDEPYAQQLVCDGTTIWHYDADLEQVVVQQYEEQARNAPILVILKDVQSLKKSFAITASGDDGRELFTLTSLDTSTNALQRVELGFRQQQLVSLTFIDTLGQKTEIAFSEIKINSPVDAALFTFTIPDGADVLHQ